MDPVARVKLDEKHFAALVRGGNVKTNNVEIILADIGFEQMRLAIFDAKENPDNHYEDYDDGTSS